MTDSIRSNTATLEYDTKRSVLYAAFGAIPGAIIAAQNKINMDIFERQADCVVDLYKGIDHLNADFNQVVKTGFISITPWASDITNNYIDYMQKFIKTGQENKSAIEQLRQETCDAYKKGIKRGKYFALFGALAGMAIGLVLSICQNKDDKTN